MANFAIRSKGDPRFVIWLRDCSQEHADSVYESVTAPGFNGPRDVVLERVDRLHDRPRRWRLSLLPWR